MAAVGEAQRRLVRNPAPAVEQTTRFAWMMRTPHLSLGKHSGDLRRTLESNPYDPSAHYELAFVFADRGGDGRNTIETLRKSHPVSCTPPRPRDILWTRGTKIRSEILHVYDQRPWTTSTMTFTNGTGPVTSPVA